MFRDSSIRRSGGLSGAEVTGKSMRCAKGGVEVEHSQRYVTEV
jgi:hypothetical protein